MACIASYPKSCMSVENDECQTLEYVAKQFRLVKPQKAGGGDINDEISENSAAEAAPTLCRFFCCSKNRAAAVLVCIFEGLQGEVRVILTKRSMKLSSHPGEVALPGGKMDEGDADFTMTALREAREEIGLDASLVQVVAHLQPFISLHLLTVVPVIAILPRAQEFEPVLNADEVEAIFDVPLEMFLKEEKRRRREKEWECWKYVCHVFDYEEEKGGRFVIGGLTASILIAAASVLFQAPPSDAEPHLPDFTQLQLALNPNQFHHPHFPAAINSPQHHPSL